MIPGRSKCNHCGDVIESTSAHDFKFCKCGVVAVDGGHKIIGDRRVGFALVKANYNDLRNGIHAPTKYLELFFSNLPLGTDFENDN